MSYVNALAATALDVDFAQIGDITVAALSLMNGSVVLVDASTGLGLFCSVVFH